MFKGLGGLDCYVYIHIDNLYKIRVCWYSTWKTHVNKINRHIINGWHIPAQAFTVVLTMLSIISQCRLLLVSMSIFFSYVGWRRNFRQASTCRTHNWNDGEAMVASVTRRPARDCLGLGRYNPPIRWVARATFGLYFLLVGCTSSRASGSGMVGCTSSRASGCTSSSSEMVITSIVGVSYSSEMVITSIVGVS